MFLFRQSNAPIVTLCPSPHSTGDDKDTNPLANLVLPPKHAHIAEMQADGNLMFEAMVFVFAVVALGLQYINLYKTVWWLPHSHSRFALVSITRVCGLHLGCCLVVARPLLPCGGCRANTP